VRKEEAEAEAKKEAEKKKGEKDTNVIRLEMEK